MTEARAEVTWSQAKGHEDGWQHQRLEETRKTLPWSPRGQAFSPPASRRDRTRFCGLEQPREQIQAAVSLSPLPSGGHRPPQLLQPASQAWSCTSVCVPLEAGGQLGKASLISEDAAAVSGPEDRGSSVLETERTDNGQIVRKDRTLSSDPQCERKTQKVKQEPLEQWAQRRQDSIHHRRPPYVLSPPLTLEQPEEAARVPNRSRAVPASGQCLDSLVPSGLIWNFPFFHREAPQAPAVLQIATKSSAVGGPPAARSSESRPLSSDGRPSVAPMACAFTHQWMDTQLLSSFGAITDKATVDVGIRIFVQMLVSQLTHCVLKAGSCSLQASRLPGTS
ncbi:uncharacterized protein LOC121019594 isoform X1 [Herpailurus yagouaroundi]|uniref:uncharacterized protein LOC121019594 isoform X1 n=1 Tax=Herpailurus yagouaroundi TaxID=1608482 RepID=UPI001AD77F46|nr:uncharacterized protein LOC121019594 isoform X1 [Puma yagouaroundi]